MTQDELRHWIGEFLQNPELGWSHCKLAFARLMGIDLQGLKSKLRQGRTQAWIHRGEQIRFSRQIRRLLAGEIVPKQLRAASGQRKWVAVIADHPQPILRQGPLRPRIDLANGCPRLRWAAAQRDDPPLPSFRAVFEREKPLQTLDEEPLRFAQGGYGPRRLPYPVATPRSPKRMRRRPK